MDTCNAALLLSGWIKAKDADDCLDVSNSLFIFIHARKVNKGASFKTSKSYADAHVVRAWRCNDNNYGIQLPLGIKVSMEIIEFLLYFLWLEN